MDALLKNSLKFCMGYNIKVPIICAPMAGITTPSLVAATCNAGAMGSLACGFLTADQIRAQIKEIKSSLKPGASAFSINVFASDSAIKEMEKEKLKIQILRMQKLLKQPSERFNITLDEELTDEKLNSLKLPSLDEQMPAILEAKPEIVTWTFGKELFPKEAARELRNMGTKLIGTATTVEEALKLEELGADAIVAQGFEAGGHRGTFLQDPKHHDINESLVGTMSLVPACVDAVSIPVIAAGGISDRRGVLAALALGASAVQVGTSFMFCKEAGTNTLHRTVLEKAAQTDTIVTRSFTGRFARGFNNKYVREMRKHGVDDPGFRFIMRNSNNSSDSDDIIPPYPIPQLLLAPIRTASIKANDPQYAQMWSGQGFQTSRKSFEGNKEPGAEDIVKELMKLIDALCSNSR